MELSLGLEVCPGLGVGPGLGVDPGLGLGVGLGLRAILGLGVSLVKALDPPDIILELAESLFPLQTADLRVKLYLAAGRLNRPGEGLKTSSGQEGYITVIGGNKLRGGAVSLAGTFARVGHFSGL